MQSTFFVTLPDEEGYVIIASSIGNHPHGDVLHRVGSQCLEAYIAPVQVTYNADDAHVAVDGYRAVFFSSATMSLRCESLSMLMETPTSLVAIMSIGVW